MLPTLSNNASCGVIYFPHIPRCGGTSSVNFFKSTLNARVFDFDFFSDFTLNNNQITQQSQKQFEELRSSPETKFHWMKQLAKIEILISDFESSPGNWLIIHQHAFTPGLYHTMENITRWRSQIEKRGCRFILLTLIRNPMKRGISHLRYFGFDEARYVQNQLMSGSNYQLKYLLFGECNITSVPLECAAKGVPTVIPEDLPTLLDLLAKFDLIGSMEQLPLFLKKFVEIVGMPGVELTHVRSSMHVNFTGLSMEQESIIKEYGVELDQYLYDVIITGKVLPPKFNVETVYPDIMCYLDRYPQLREAYCKPKCKIKRVYWHWHKHGRFEKKAFYCNEIPRQDLDCYEAQNHGALREFCGEDSCSYPQIQDHWHLIGKPQGLRMNCVNMDKKLRCNAILAPDLFQRYCHGRSETCNIAKLREKWNGDQLFDCAYVEKYKPHFCYATRYQHLLEEFCSGHLTKCDVAGLERHWNNAGKSEKMAFGCIDENLLSRLQCFVEYHRSGKLIEWYCEGSIFLCEWEEIFKRYTKAGFGKVIGQEDFSCDITTTSELKQSIEQIDTLPEIKVDLLQDYSSISPSVLIFAVLVFAIYTATLDGSPFCKRQKSPKTL